jgi:hypothetical protein
MKKGVKLVRGAASPQLKRTTVSAKITATPYLHRARTKGTKRQQTVSKPAKSKLCHVCKEEGTLTKCADDCIHDGTSKRFCRECSPGTFCICIGLTSKKTVRIRDCKTHGTNVMCEVSAHNIGKKTGTRIRNCELCTPSVMCSHGSRRSGCNAEKSYRLNRQKPSVLPFPPGRKPPSSAGPEAAEEASPPRSEAAFLIRAFPPQEKKKKMKMEVIRVQYCLSRWREAGS